MHCISSAYTKPTVCRTHSCRPELHTPAQPYHELHVICVYKAYSVQNTLLFTWAPYSYSTVACTAFCLRIQSLQCIKHTAVYLSPVFLLIRSMHCFLSAYTKPAVYRTHCCLPEPRTPAQKPVSVPVIGSSLHAFCAKAPCPPAQQTPARKRKVVLVLKEICLHASYAKAPCPPAQQTPARKRKVVLMLKDICLHASYAKAPCPPAQQTPARKKKVVLVLKEFVYMHLTQRRHVHRLSRHLRAIKRLCSCLRKFVYMHLTQRRYVHRLSRHLRAKKRLCSCLRKFVYMHLMQRCHVHRLSRHLHAKKKVVRVLKDICLHASYAKAPCPPAQLTPTRKKKVVLVLKEICLHASYAKKRLCSCLRKFVYMHLMQKKGCACAWVRLLFTCMCGI